ncbi:MAG: uL15m family ribosomal protein, partial [Candidatus Woesebacteria bacterium]
SRVDIDLLVKHGIVRESDAKRVGVKILGGGEIKKKLTVDLPTSKSAAKKIKKAGGEVVGTESKETKKTKSKKTEKTKRKKTKKKSKAK